MRVPFSLDLLLTTLRAGLLEHLAMLLLGHTLTALFNYGTHRTALFFMLSFLVYGVCREE